jgi:transposase
VISVEVSENLEYRRPQYALPENAGVIACAMPDHSIAKCKADVGLLAQAIVSKFADHLSLYRQDSIFDAGRGDDSPSDADQLAHADL